MDHSMKSGYISGGVTALFGGFLLLYLIPTFVASTDGLMSPDLFPSIAAWMFILLGVIQVISPGEDVELPSSREFMRTGLIALTVLVAILAMDWFGYIIVAVSFMVAITMLMYERRPIWLIATVIAMPIGIWLFFEVLLRRPLPSLPF